jgi:hypothetical protein
MLLDEFRSDMDVFYAALLAHYVSPSNKDERRSYIKVNQRLLIRLIDKLNQVSEIKGISPEVTAF